MSSNTTPIVKRSFPKDDLDDEVSPFFMKFTQDSCEDEVDVLWDWDSPCSKGTSTRALNRRRIIHSSPNLTMKRAAHSSSLPRFNSLKAELEQLANKLTHEKDDSNNTHCQFGDNLFLKPVTPHNNEQNTEDEDLFNDDSFNEEMIKCSQKVEEAYQINQWCTSIITNNNKNVSETIQDDSFDFFLEKIEDEDIERLSQTTQQDKNIILPPTVSVPSPRSIIRTNSFPVELIYAQRSSLGSSTSFLRTKSAEIPDQRENNHRLKCSPEEIEKKRLQAKAKLEFKRKHTEIERKRLEAQERLKKNRMRRQNYKNP